MKETLAMKDSIRFNHFKNIYDNLVNPLGEADWATLCEFFSTHESINQKENVPLFNLVRYLEEFDPDHPDENMGFSPETRQFVSLRRKINLIQVDALVLDYDGGVSIDEAKERFADYEYLGYTSYNHLKDGETHKFRLIFPIAVPIPINPRVEQLAVYDELAVPLGEFAGPCDPVVYRPNQHYYIPATHPDRIDQARAWNNNGKILDWREWEIPNQENTKKSSSYYFKQRPGINNQLDPETEFVTEKGLIIASDVEGIYQKVQCPFHDDQKGTEFLKRFEDSGVIYFHCKRCGGYSLEPQTTDFAETKRPVKIIGDFEIEEAYPTLGPENIDRKNIQKELKRISQKIFMDQTTDKLTGRISEPKPHIVYTPEGSGKSVMAVDMVKKGCPLVFACQSWDQVYKKQKEFQELLKSDDPDEHINVKISHSFESQFRNKWGFETIRAGSTGGYKTREIDKEATIAKIKEKVPKISRKYIELWWGMFSQNPDKISQAMYKAMEEYELMSVEYDNDIGYVVNEWLEPNKPAAMVITTFSQLRLNRVKGDYIPQDWLIWYDDPGLDDVANFDPIEGQEEHLARLTEKEKQELPDPFNLGTKGKTIEELIKSLEETHGYSHTEVNETLDEIEADKGKLSTGQKKPVKSACIQGISYHKRPIWLSLGFSTLRHRMVFTTTELLTKQALNRHLLGLRLRPVNHEMMEKLPYGYITVLGTDKVRRRQDAIIPLILNSLNKKGQTAKLIADGLGSDFNHVNSKGINTLADTNILVEVSIPHPMEVRKVCAILKLEYSTNQREITLNLMLDKIHQAIGRNSGYRWKGKECVVLVDKSYHAEIIKNIRYQIDPVNSVVIDRTQSMSSKSKRITSYASPMTIEIEDQLNQAHKIFGDRRSITHTIDYVIKHIEDGEKRIQYIARLLTAIATFSKTRLEKPTDDSVKEHSRLKNYRLAWDHIQSKWVNDSNRTKIMTNYETNMKDTN